MISGQKTARERIRSLSHEGKQILFLDLSNCTPRQVEETMRKVPDLIATHAPGSALILTDFAGASFDDHAVMALQEAAVFDKPYVKKSALVGTRSLPDHVYEAMKSFSRREWGIFHSRTEAVDWLVQE